MKKPFGHVSPFRWIVIVGGFLIIICGGVWVWGVSQDIEPGMKAVSPQKKVAQPQPNASCSSNCTESNGPVSPPAHSYIALGKIPTEGLEVGVTFYGALESPENGHYILSNLIQGGVKNGGAYNGYDDNGEGACEGKYANLTNQATWAEDDNGTILGQLPCGSKLEISYHGHTIVAEKGDTSNGGCTAPTTRCSDNGHVRMIDLWWQTAKALCFTDQPDVMTIHAVPTSTPTTIIPSYIANDMHSTATCQ